MSTVRKQMTSVETDYMIPILMLIDEVLDMSLNLHVT